MTIADDLRKAADMLDDSFSPHPVIARLRAHADTIERVEREMMGPAFWLVDEAIAKEIMRQWTNALRGDSNGK